MNKQLIEKHLQDVDYLRKNPQIKQYDVITVDLTVAHTDKSYEIMGSCLAVNILIVEATKWAKVRINQVENPEISLKQGQVIETTIHRIFISNNAYASGTMEIVIGIDFKVEV